MQRPYSYVILSMLPLCLQAQTDEGVLYSDLGGVEVMSTRSFADVIPSQSLDSVMLQRMQSLSVADALRHFAGVQVKDYGGIGGIKTVNVRSMGSEHLGVYYDGIELGNAQNGQIDLGQFSLDNVEQITLYNGQKSSLMQTASDYGNAGSVYIRTRQPRFAAGRATNFRGRVKYGLGNQLQLSAVLEQRLSSNITASLSVGTLTSDGHYSFRYKRTNSDGSTAYDTTAVRQNGDVQLLRAEANIYGILPRGSWSAKAYTYQSKRGIPGAIVNNVWRREERQCDANTFVQAMFQQDISNAYTMRVLGKYANYYTHYQNRDTTSMLVNNHYRQQEAYLSTTHAVQVMPWLSASAAYDVRYSTLHADVYNCPQPHRWSHLASLATAITLPRLTAQASLLYTHAQDHGKSAQSGATVVGADFSVSRLTPAFFFCYTPFRSSPFSLRGYVKNSFRMPTFNDLYYAEIGNSNLKPERATQYDLGVKYSFAIPHTSFHVDMTVDGYYNTVHDKIIAYPKGQQFRWTMLNLGRVHITGLDLTASARGHIGSVEAGLRCQYTYQKAIDVTSSATSYYRDQIPYTPHHSGSLTADATWRALTLTYTFIYTGERYSQQENITYNKLQAWYTSDVALTCRQAIGNTMLHATLEVNNLFSQDYEVILNYPMPGRHFGISVGVEI